MTSLPRLRPTPAKSLLTLGFIAAGLLLIGATTARADAIDQTVSTSSGNATIGNWNGAVWGTPAAAPTSGSNYVSDGGDVTELRTGGGNFAGDSLTLQNGAILTIKGNTSANFILKSGGTLEAAASANTISGTVVVNSGDSGVFMSNSNYRLTINALISGSGDIDIAQITPGGTLRTVTITNTANTFSGNWVVQSSALTMNKSNTLGSGNLVLAGGDFQSAGFSQTFGTLTLSASDTIDLGAGSSAIAFADSSGATWGSSFTLSVINYDLGVDSIRFGTDANALTTAQLSQITLNGSAAMLDAYGYLTVASVIPEPATYALLGGLFVLLIAVRQRRKPRAA